jgi:hypothetical protein
MSTRIQPRSALDAARARSSSIRAFRNHVGDGCCPSAAIARLTNVVIRIVFSLTSASHMQHSFEALDDQFIKRHDE